MARAEQRASLPYTNTRVPHQRPEHRPLKPLHNRTFRCGGHGAAFCPLSFTFSMTPDSLDWTWIWPICHAWLGWSVCVRLRRCVCVHVLEVVQSSKSRWFWILLGYSSDHVHPWGDPCVHGKVTTPFETGIPRVSAAVSENSNTFPTWGAPCVTRCRLKSVMLAGMLFCCQQLTEFHFWDCGVPPLMIQP